MKIISEKANEQSVFDMKDGDIAIITKWNTENHEGKIVQRFQNNLVTLNKHSGESWSSFFNLIVKDREILEMRIRILRKGTVIEL